MSRFAPLQLDFSETIATCFENILSGCLPHENHDQKVSSSLLRELRVILKLEETTGAHHILYKALLAQLSIVAIKKDFVPCLSRENIELSLEVGLNTLVLDPGVKMTYLLQDMGEDPDLTVQKNFNRAQDILLTITLNLYDKLIEKAVSTTEAYSLLSTLQQAITEEFVRDMVRKQAILLNEGIKIGNKFYHSPNDLLEFVQSCKSYIESRENSGSNRIVSITSLEQSREFTEDNKHSIYPLFPLGIPPIDDIEWVQTRDIISVIGDEGVGKTNLLVFVSVSCMLQGYDVLIMVGESLQVKIRNMILSRFMHAVHFKKLSWREILEMDISDDEVVRLVAKAEYELFEGDKYGKLHMVDDFFYETYEESIDDHMERYPNTRLVLIDHIDSLKSTGSLTSNGYLRTKKDKVDYLYQVTKGFKKRYESSFILLAHTGAETTKALAKGKETGVRVGATSGAVTKDVDKAYLLSAPSHLERQDMVLFEVKKMREGKRYARPVVLKRDFVTSNFIYKEEFQDKAENDIAALI